jgi:hypothetical protein
MGIGSEYSSTNVPASRGVQYVENKEQKVALRPSAEDFVASSSRSGIVVGDGNCGRASTSSDQSPPGHVKLDDDKRRQNIILEGMAEALLCGGSIPTILGGDLNAAPHGGRFGYSVSNAKNLKEFMVGTRVPFSAFYAKATTYCGLCH